MSHRGDLTERLVRIPLLLAERPRSQQELAQEFNVDGITIRRNLNELSRFYYITDERRGRQVFYRFGAGYQYCPPNFMPGELATLLLAQQSIAATGLASFGIPFAGYGRAPCSQRGAPRCRRVCAIIWMLWPASSALRRCRRKTTGRMPERLTN